MNYQDNTINLYEPYLNIYDFEAADFGLSGKGIHLLRSGYNYNTIEYENVKKATMTRGSELHNSALAFVFGAGLIAFAFFVHGIYIESIILPLLPCLTGIYLIYNALKKVPILIVETGNTRKKLKLKEFIKNDVTDDLKNYLGQKLSARFLAEDRK